MAIEVKYKEERPIERIEIPSKHAGLPGMVLRRGEGLFGKGPVWHFGSSFAQSIDIYDIEITDVIRALEIARDGHE